MEQALACQIIQVAIKKTAKLSAGCLAVELWFLALL
jgi:hypothetical protein